MMKRLVLTSLVLLSMPTIAEDSVVGSIETSASPFNNLYGSVDIRPSLEMSALADDGFRTRNSVGLGYQFSKNISLDYTQKFDTNLANGAPNGGLDLQGYDGNFRGRFKKVWQSPSQAWNLELQQRIYLPTDPDKAADGLLFDWRSYAVIHRVVGSSLDLSGSVVPIVYFNSSGLSANGLEANKNFELRLIAEAKWSITDKLQLNVPLTLKNRHHVGVTPTVKYNDTWSYKLELYPELSYALSNNLQVGLAFETASLIRSDFSDTSITDAFEGGTAQILFRATI